MSARRINLKKCSYLAKKLLTICPICSKKIYGKDIDIEQIEKYLGRIYHCPFKYVHCHKNYQTPLHAITLYLDSDFAVRGNEVSEFVKIQK